MKTASMEEKSSNSSVFVVKLNDFSSSKRHCSAQRRTATRDTKSSAGSEVSAICLHAFFLGGFSPREAPGWEMRSSA